jgi:hypothetical protein
MTDKEDSSRRDLLGLAPISRAVERVTDSVMSGAEALLSRICLPAAEELGLLFRDKIGEWRKQNALATVAKAQTRLEQAAADGRHAQPRLIMESLNHASWADSDQVQEMWAGLLASSCTEDGKDDSNWIFINLLGQLTAMQATLLRHSCEHAKKVVSSSGLIGTEFLHRTADDLKQVSGCSDIQRIDRELDHLRALGLIAVGFREGLASQPLADLRPTALALHLFVRSQGSTDDPIVYFGLAGAQA